MLCRCSAANSLWHYIAVTTVFPEVKCLSELTDVFRRLRTVMHVIGSPSALWPPLLKKLCFYALVMLSVFSLYICVWLLNRVVPPRTLKGTGLGIITRLAQQGFIRTTQLPQTKYSTCIDIVIIMVVSSQVGCSRPPLSLVEGLGYSCAVPLMECLWWVHWLCFRGVPLQRLLSECSCSWNLSQ